MITPDKEINFRTSRKIYLLVQWTSSIIFLIQKLVIGVTISGGVNKFGKVAGGKLFNLHQNCLDTWNLEWVVLVKDIKTETGL